MTESAPTQPAAHGHEPEYHFFVDSERYTTTSQSLTGAEIKAQAAVNPTYQLFLEEEGDRPDLAIADTDSVRLERGERTRHFYAVPPATFGI
jgi:hypothetical protein